MKCQYFRRRNSCGDADAVVHRHWKATSIHKNAFSDLRAADAVSSAFRLGEGPTDEALVQPILASLLDQASRTQRWK